MPGFYGVSCSSTCPAPLPVQRPARARYACPSVFHLPHDRPWPSPVVPTRFSTRTQTKCQFSSFLFSPPQPAHPYLCTTLLAYVSSSRPLGLDFSNGAEDHLHLRARHLHHPAGAGICTALCVPKIRTLYLCLHYKAAGQQIRHNNFCRTSRHFT